MAKIEFSNEQYQRLMKLVYLGNWVINAQKAPDEHLDAYEEIEEMIFSHAKEFGLGHLVHKEEDKIYPSAEFESDPDMQKFIDEYNEGAFWDELCEKLALREAFDLYGEEALGEMDAQERFLLICRLEDKYNREFYHNGIDNLTFKS